MITIIPQTTMSPNGFALIINGRLVKVFDDYFIILDREDGEVPVFFVDIHIFELFNGNASTLKKIGEGNGKE